MEKMDLEFVWWILFEGRSGKQDWQYQKVLKKYGKKTVVIRNQRELELVGKCFVGAGVFGKPSSGAGRGQAF